MSPRIRSVLKNLKNISSDDNHTPEWAAEICDVPAYIIKSLAREWASKRTMLAGGSRGGESGTCRQAYGTEWARLMVLLQAMQGLGKPGRQYLGHHHGAALQRRFRFPRL